jgi:hypothetical protein
MNNEHSFFEALAGTTLPGWDVKLQAHMQPGQMDLASYSARVYLVATSTGWTAAGAMQPSGFAAIAQSHKDAGLTVERVTDMAGHCLNKLGREQPEANSPDVALGIELIASALTSTQTFEAVKPTGLEGHWVYIGYQMLDSSTICRPGFFRTHEAGFVPPEALTHYVRQVVANDMGNAQSSVGRMIKRAGGAIISPQYK